MIVGVSNTCPDLVEAVSYKLWRHVTRCLLPEIVVVGLSTENLRTMLQLRYLVVLLPATVCVAPSCPPPALYLTCVHYASGVS